MTERKFTVNGGNFDWEGRGLCVWEFRRGIGAERSIAKRSGAKRIEAEERRSGAKGTDIALCPG